MNKDFFCVLFFLSVMFLLIFCCTFAEVYENPDIYQGFQHCRPTDCQYHCERFSEAGTD